MLFTFLSLFNFGKFATEVKPTLIVLKNSSSSNSSVRPSILPSYDLQLSRTSSLTWKKEQCKNPCENLCAGNKDFNSQAKDDTAQAKMKSIPSSWQVCKRLSPGSEPSFCQHARLAAFQEHGYLALLQPLTFVLCYKWRNQVRNINPGLSYLVVRSRPVFGKCRQKALQKNTKRGFLN